MHEALKVPLAFFTKFASNLEGIALELFDSHQVNMAIPIVASPILTNAAACIDLKGFLIQNQSVIVDVQQPTFIALILKGNDPVYGEAIDINQEKVQDPIKGILLQRSHADFIFIILSEKFKMTDTQRPAYGLGEHLKLFSNRYLLNAIGFKNRN